MIPQGQGTGAHARARRGGREQARVRQGATRRESRRERKSARCCLFDTANGYASITAGYCMRKLIHTSHHLRLCGNFEQAPGSGVADRAIEGCFLRKQPGTLHLAFLGFTVLHLLHTGTCELVHWQARLGRLICLDLGQPAPPPPRDWQPLLQQQQVVAAELQGMPLRGSRSSLTLQYAQAPALALCLC